MGYREISAPYIPSPISYILLLYAFVRKMGSPHLLV
jgi:hypothetical protein